jgi:hypothetical protein
MHGAVAATLELRGTGQREKDTKVRMEERW